MFLPVCLVLSVLRAFRGDTGEGFIRESICPTLPNQPRLHDIGSTLFVVGM
jgi:hypothetical protein